MTFDLADAGAANRGNLALFDADIQTFDVGKKLRILCATTDPLERVWGWVRLPLAIVLVALIVAFIAFALRRLTGGDNA